MEDKDSLDIASAQLSSSTFVGVFQYAPGHNSTESER